MKPTILETIIANKKEEIELKKAQIPLDELMQKVRNRERYSLKANLLKTNSNGIIAEFKRKSPSKGWLYPDAKVLDVTIPYEKAGVCGMSILTDEKFFGGTDADVIEAAKVLKSPILRKEFIVDPYQVYEANIMGADVILLIASVLSPDEVKEFAVLCRKIGLETLLEIHGESELGHICEEVSMVGINNRNLHSFEVSLDHSIQLAKQIPDRFVKIAESGISSLEDIIKLKHHGFKGFLMGEYFMKTPDPGLTCQNLIKQLMKE